MNHSVEVYTTAAMESLWKSLGNEWFILFGLECGRSALWIFVVLIQRTLFEVMHISDYIPYGLYFALPLTMQVRCQLCLALESFFPSQF